MGVKIFTEHITYVENQSGPVAGNSSENHEQVRMLVTLQLLTSPEASQVMRVFQPCRSFVFELDLQQGHRKSDQNHETISK